MFSIKGFIKSIVLFSIIKTLSGKKLRNVVPGCDLTPEIEEGPFYYNGSYVRQNIIESQAGIPLTLIVTVIDTNNCSVIVNAAVDLWHTNATGAYSHFEKRRRTNTTYLRGIQLSNSSGQLVFNTIYPGYYEGRTTHIHVKVRFGGQETTNGSVYYWGGHTSHTGQIFFHDNYTTLVQQVQPYSLNKARRTFNKDDDIYRHEHGVDSMLTLEYVDSTQGVTAGFIGNVALKVDSTVNPDKRANASRRPTETRDDRHPIAGYRFIGYVAISAFMMLSGLLIFSFIRLKILTSKLKYIPVSNEVEDFKTILQSDVNSNIYIAEKK